MYNRLCKNKKAKIELQWPKSRKVRALSKRQSLLVGTVPGARIKVVVFRASFLEYIPSVPGITYLN